MRKKMRLGNSNNLVNKSEPKDKNNFLLNSEDFHSYWALITEILIDVLLKD